MKENKNILNAKSFALVKLRNILGIIIAVIAFCLYTQSLSFNYAYDDVGVFKENNLVKKGFSAIPILIKTDRLFGWNESERMPEYRPVQMVMFAMEWQLFPDSPHFYHLINVLLFSLTCWLLFLLLCKLFENQNLVFPFICALLFTAHPIHTEVVDNIKSLDEILCFLFAILAVFLFIKANDKHYIVKMVLASIFFFLSLLSKETGIVYLVIIPLILFVFSKANIKKILIIIFTLAVISFIYFLIRSKILESIPQSRIESLLSPGFNSLLASPNFISQKATAFYILLKYFLLLVFPYNLSCDYSIAQIPTQQINSIGALSGIICYLILGIYAILKIRKKDIVAFAILFYLLTLAPVSNIFFLINWTMGERFLFMPSLGFCMLLAFLLMKITKVELNKSKFKTVPQLIKMNSRLFTLVLIISGLYSIRTIARNPDWKDNYTLFSHDVKVVPNNACVHLFYGKELLYTLFPKEKNKEKQDIIINRAINEFTKAISIYQTPDAYSNIGAAFLTIRDYENAIINYEAAIRLYYPQSPAYVYCDLGSAYNYTGQYKKALSILDTSIKYYPNYLDAYVKKSYSYLTSGKNEEAIVESDKLLKIDSNNVIAYENKGCGFLNLKQYKKAIENFNKGIRLDSTNVECLQYLGTAYKEKGDTIKAKQYFERENRIRSEMQH